MISPKDRANAQAQGLLLTALANPNRLKILMLLRTGEMSVNQVAAALYMSNSVASGHLLILHARNLVTRRRDGNRIYYGANSLELGPFLSTILVNATPKS